MSLFRMRDIETNGFQFTEKQKYGFEQMLKGKNIFLTGQAGVGKSFILNQFIQFFRENMEDDKNQIYVTSTTGISALIIGGQTIHRYCGIGTGEKPIDELFKKIMQNVKTKKRYLSTKVLIIDEISMMSPELFDKIDLLFRKVRKCERPFGGIQLIVSGDLLQLPPVKADGFIFDAFNWDEVIEETIYLDEVMRQNDNDFIQILNKIRLGQVDEQVKMVIESRRGIEIHNEYGVMPSRLFSKRDMVKKVNDEELKRLIEEGETKKEFKCTYEFSKSVKEENQEYMKALIQENTDVEDELVFTTKCQVMLKVNIPELKLANGSRGIIIGFGPVTGYPIVQFLDGRYMEIAPHKWDMEDQRDKVSKIQIPLQLAFAISFHKAQGSTLEYVIIDIGRDVFEFGQTYVALSRVKSLDGLFISGSVDYTKIRANPRVLKYYEKLSSK